MRPIDADALTEDCKRYLGTLNPDRDGKECTRIHWLIGVLANASTIEPERKVGKWTRSHGIYCDRAWCSNCSSAFSIDPNHPFKTPMDWKYCPDCGSYNGGEL